MDWPETATFLTEDEKKLLIARLATDVADAKMNRFDKPAVKRIFTDWKMYCGILMYFGIVNNGYAVSVGVAESQCAYALANSALVLHTDYPYATWV